VALLLAVAVVPMGGAGAVTEHGADDHPAGHAGGGAASGAADVDPYLLEQSGTVEAVVRFPEADLSTVPEDERVAHLQRHADRSQAAFVAFAERTPGVELERSFWLANAVVVSVDTGSVPLDEVAAVDGVTAVHRNRAGGGDDRHGTAADADSSSSPAGAARTRRQGQQAVTPALEQMNVRAARDFHDTRGEGAAVAVLDTGVDPEGHEGIAASLDRGGWAAFDADTGERTGEEPNDWNGHGTKISGIVAGGRTDDGTQFGVAPAATLYHGKVVSEDGFTFASITAGMEWAIENDVDVISMSFGPARYAPELVEPVENARDSGAVVVAAAANTHRYTSAAPANYPTTLGVGAVDADGNVPEWSAGERVDTERYWERPPSEWPDEYVVPEVTAPGVGLTVPEPGGGYDTAEGASYAAPHAAGVAALAVAATDADGETVRETLVETARHPSADEPLTADPGRDARHGTGTVDAMSALSSLRADRTVSGTVTDESGDPIAGAVVASEAGTHTTTDASGRYTLEAPAGEQPVGAFAFGYRVQGEAIDPAATDSLDFALRRSDAPNARVVDPMPTRVDPGQPATATFAISNVETVAVQAELEGAVAQDDVTVTVDGEEVPLGDSVSFDEPRTADELTVTLTADEGVALGSISPYVAFDTSGEQVSGTLPPLYVHPDPFFLGPDAPVGPGGPLDVLAPGTTMTLGDGTYETSGLVIQRPVTLTAAEGADPRIAADGGDAAVVVTANDVELSGLTIDGGGAERVVQVGTEARGREMVAPSGVTVADTRIEGGSDGLVTYGAPALRVERNEVTVDRTGVEIADPHRTTVRDNAVDGAETGIAVRGFTDGVTGNTIRGAGTAIVVDVPPQLSGLLSDRLGPIADNTIRDSETGVQTIGNSEAVGDNTFEDVEEERVDEGAPEDSPLGAVLYVSALVSVAFLFVPYGVRRFRRR